MFCHTHKNNLVDWNIFRSVGVSRIPAYFQTIWSSAIQKETTTTRVEIQELIQSHHCQQSCNWSLKVNHCNLKWLSNMLIFEMKNVLFTYKHLDICSILPMHFYQLTLMVVGGVWLCPNFFQTAISQWKKGEVPNLVTFPNSLWTFRK